MRFHKQLNRHIPSQGEIGDCLRTAIACLLNLHPSEVPNFAEHGNDEHVRPAVRHWLAKRKLALLDVPYQADEEHTLAMLTEHLSKVNGDDLCYMVTGMGLAGPHVVIYCGAKVIHDPSPNNVGIQEPINGVYWVSYILPSFMRFAG